MLPLSYYWASSILYHFPSLNTLYHLIQIHSIPSSVYQFYKHEIYTITVGVKPAARRAMDPRIYPVDKLHELAIPYTFILNEVVVSAACIVLRVWLLKPWQDAKNSRRQLERKKNGWYSIIRETNRVKSYWKKEEVTSLPTVDQHSW